jgi:hypothetical protein
VFESNSPTHVFRFVQMRPPGAATEDDVILLGGETPLARKLIGSPPARRVEMARAHARQALPSIKDLLASAWAQRILEIAVEVLAQDGSVGEFRRRARGSLPEGDSAFFELSDMLLASKFAGRSTLGAVRDAARLFRAMHLLRSEGKRDAETKLSSAMTRALVYPPALAREESPGGVRAERAANERRDAATAAPRVSAWPDRVERTMRELMAAYQAQAAQERGSGAEGTAPRSTIRNVLDTAALARIGGASQGVLRSLSLDVTSRPIVSALAELEAAMTLPPRDTAADSTPLPAPGPSAPSSLAEAQVRASGIADLLIVKQHLVGYQRSDIAHVENVMAGESRDREHRLLERSEQTTILEREQIEVKETELQTAERFELQQETQQTIQRDQQVGFGLSISGKYGPSVEFSSNLETESSTSTEEMARSALTYAKDVMERSLQRVTQRVREEQIRKLIRESEETNKHGFKNETGAHIVGTYQFLEKEYESQIFNYGIRQMFDFMVPEPASYIWHLEQQPGSDLALPPPPPKLEDFVTSAAGISAGNYREIAAAVGARGVQPPPPLTKYTTVSLKHGETGDEGGKPQSVIDKEIPVPEGYVPWVATVRAVALTDDKLNLAITIGTDTEVFSPRDGEVSDLDGLDLGTLFKNFIIGTNLSSQFDPQAKLPLHVAAFETHSYSVVVQLLSARTEAWYDAWQLKTYDQLAQAAREQQAAYDQQVSDLRARARAEEAANTVSRFDAPPSEHQRVIRGELKKHCLSIITRQWYSEPNGMLGTDPPSFDLDVAASRGAFIRFFEQAFEWDQIQYVCYPYFWARRETWGDRFRRTEVDPKFLEFLQAGAARVVVPVRPGFEAAVLHFLETLEATGTGEIWNGMGEPPPITSPLYVSIVREIQERTNAPLGEIAVGEPWRTTLPTPLVILRPDASLPRWQRASPEGWEWSEVP